MARSRRRRRAARTSATPLVQQVGLREAQTLAARAPSARGARATTSESSAGKSSLVNASTRGLPVSATTVSAISSACSTTTSAARAEERGALRRPASPPTPPGRRGPRRRAAARRRDRSPRPCRRLERRGVDDPQLVRPRADDRHGCTLRDARSKSASSAEIHARDVVLAHLRLDRRGPRRRSSSLHRQRPVDARRPAPRRRTG